jgi:hypothetical protein
MILTQGEQMVWVAAFVGGFYELPRPEIRDYKEGEPFYNELRMRQLAHGVLRACQTVNGLRMLQDPSALGKDALPDEAMQMLRAILGEEG